jgi:hypothetical protein
MSGITQVYVSYSPGLASQFTPFKQLIKGSKLFRSLEPFSCLLRIHRLQAGHASRREIGEKLESLQ